MTLKIFNFMLSCVNNREKKFLYNVMLIYVNYVNITDRRTDGQTYQNYSSEPHKTKNVFKLNQTFYLNNNRIKY